ncbi:hypothetical protein BKA63DRAFT_566947 [Paraphoma chrysanthemicola]|nr:hypothetical protein BKA63DRAFT_566947 [Paraphoma chrysanthemicola]
MLSSSLTRILRRPASSTAFKAVRFRRTTTSLILSQLRAYRHQSSSRDELRDAIRKLSTSLDETKHQYDLLSQQMDSEKEIRANSKDLNQMLNKKLLSLTLLALAVGLAGGISDLADWAKTKMRVENEE